MQKLSARSIPIYLANLATFEENWIPDHLLRSLVITKLCSIFMMNPTVYLQFSRTMVERLNAEFNIRNDVQFNVRNLKITDATRIRISIRKVKLSSDFQYKAALCTALFFFIGQTNEKVTHKCIHFLLRSKLICELMNCEFHGKLFKKNWNNF